MEAVHYPLQPSVRRAGCVLILLLIVSHGPFLIFRPSLIPSGLVRVTVIFSLILVYWVRGHPGTVSVCIITLCRTLVSLNETLNVIVRELVLKVSRFVSLSELTKEIVFDYTVGVWFGGRENGYVFAWVLSLLCNHVVGFSFAVYICPMGVETFRDDVSTLKRLSLLAVGGVLVSLSIRLYSVLYTVTTMAYYCLTQEWLINTFIIAAKNLDLDVFDGLEKFYLWIIVFLAQFCLGSTHAIFLMFQVDFHLLTMTIFAPVVLMLYVVCYPAVLGLNRFSTILHHYSRQLALFPSADPDEILGLSDDVCAVCLVKMHSARRTPCRHYFHGKCLIRCLRHRSTCPMCKAKFQLR